MTAPGAPQQYCHRATSAMTEEKPREPEPCRACRGRGIAWAGSGSAWVARLARRYGSTRPRSPTGRSALTLARHATLALDQISPPPA